MDFHEDSRTPQRVSPVSSSLQRTITPVLVALLILAWTGAALALSPSRALGSAPASPSAKLTPRPGMLVSAAWLAAHLKDPNVVILYVGRKEAEYKRSHIPGAHYVAWKDIVVDRDGVLNEMPPLQDLVALVRSLGVTQDSHIVIYDDGEGVHAARTYVTFDYLGMGDRTSLLDGLWKKWVAEKRPVSTDIPKATTSDFIPNPQPQILISLQEMRDFSWEKTGLKNAPVVLLDARSKDQYSGEKAGEDIQRPGHIPGAVNVFSGENFLAKDDPCFRPVNQLDALYSGVAPDPTHPVVAYCRTGVQASLAYFTLKYLGYNARLYDGSYSQWSHQPDTAIDGPTSPSATVHPKTSR